MLELFSLTEALLVFWVVCGILILLTNKTYRIIIFFGIFSLFSAILFLFTGAPDVAVAEAAVSAFATVFFIVCIEQFYLRNKASDEKRLRFNTKAVLRGVFACVLVVAAFLLFLWHVPDAEISTYLKNQYLLLFRQDVGGQNAVTSIYLGYRVYDTLFESLILVIAVVAASHMSWYDKDMVTDGLRSEIVNSSIAKFVMRIIGPIILVFGIYLAINGTISPGGGFQSGAVIASFFICRYLVLNIYDLPIKKVAKLEEMIFINIAILPIIVVFMSSLYLGTDPGPVFQNIYLTIMNGLIGLKVACGFFILFYRYIAIERLPDTVIQNKEL